MKKQILLTIVLLTVNALADSSRFTTNNIVGTYNIKGKDVCIHNELILDGTGKATLTNLPPCGSPDQGSCEGTYSVQEDQILMTNLLCNLQGEKMEIEHIIDLNGEGLLAVGQTIKKEIKINLNGELIEGLTFDIKRTK